jgi:tol-pal system protein YbgF
VREETALLRGQLETTQYQLQKVATEEESRAADLKRLEKAVQSHLDRIVRIEEYLGLEPSEKLVSSETGQEGTIEEGEEIRETPEELYRRAKELFDQGEYENARELFRSFVNQFPKSKVADNAQFWLGEIYYREKWYEKAILEYQKVIENYPDGNKTPSALLKQGFAFLNLNDKANARLILKELIRKFPDSNEARVAKNKLAALE